MADYPLFDISPNDFLNLIRNAEYVCTDSFHGCAFSIIAEKKFFVYNRYSDNSLNSKNSRIDTVCSNLGLNDRRVTIATDLYSKIKTDINYNQVRERLLNFQEAMRIYLKSSIV